MAVQMSRGKDRLTDFARGTKNIEAHFLGHIPSSQTEIDTSCFRVRKGSMVVFGPGMETSETTDLNHELRITVLSFSFLFDVLDCLAQGIICTI